MSCTFRTLGEMPVREDTYPRPSALRSRVKVSPIYDLYVGGVLVNEDTRLGSSASCDRVASTFPCRLFRASGATRSPLLLGEQ